MTPPKSKTWSYFQKIDGGLTKCKFCLQNVRYCGNTSNLAKHLKKHANRSQLQESQENLRNVTTKQSKLFKHLSVTK